MDNPKLFFLVNKILKSPDHSHHISNGHSNNINVINELVLINLLQYHKEYQRKNQSTLKKAIEIAVWTVLNNKNSNNNNNISVDAVESFTPPNKRQREEEKDPERTTNILLFETTETTPSSTTINNNMLNATLCANYQERQKKKEQQQALLSLLEEKTNDIDNTCENNLSVNNGGDDNNNVAGVNQSKTAPSSTVRKKSKKSVTQLAAVGTDVAFNVTASERPKARFADLGGMDKCLEEVRQIIEYPLQHPELFQHLGVEPPRGVLFRGPPGTGKTLLAEAIAGSLVGVTFYKVCGTEIVSGVTGESELRLRMLFEQAYATEPSIIFIDEIDAIAPKREGGSRAAGMEKRIVAQLLTCMDSIATHNVMVLGATNRPDAIDSALRRAGRFDREILIGVPDEEARCQILMKMTRAMRLAGDFNFTRIAKLTPGYVGADLRALTKEAAVIAINRIFKQTNSNVSIFGKPEDNDAPIIPLTTDEMEPLYIVMDDFLEAIKYVQPSSKREGFATVPDVTWDNIGALESIREELALSVIEPIRHPERFKELGLPLPAGVMLYGPPGCGKTLLAKAIASQSGANFISVKGPELLDKYVGESERAVRRVFERAKASCPCIVFFDELDSLCPRRGGSSETSGGGVSERVVNQLLTEMDGLESRRSVFVIAATNRPELIDPAMMRPGRLDKLLYVPLPTPDDRASILKALSTNVNISKDVNVEELAKSKRADGFSGADCAALLREAGLAVLRDHALDRIRRRASNSGDNDIEVEQPLQITEKHFNYAFDHVMPSVSKTDQKKYDRMRDRMARARSRALEDVKEKDENGDSNISINQEGSGGVLTL